MIINGFLLTWSFIAKDYFFDLFSFNNFVNILHQNEEKAYLSMCRWHDIEKSSFYNAVPKSQNPNDNGTLDGQAKFKPTQF